MDSAVDGDYSACEIAEPDFFKAGVAHHFRQFFLGWMLANTFGQIAVTFLVTGNQFTQHGQDAKRVTVVHFFQQFGLDL